MINPNNTFVLNMDNKPLARSQNVGWKPCNGSNTIANGLPKAGVAVRMKTSGFNAGAIVGTLKVTWYMTCRGIAPA